MVFGSVAVVRFSSCCTVHTLKRVPIWKQLLDTIQQQQHLPAHYWKKSFLVGAVCNYEAATAVFGMQLRAAHNSNVGGFFSRTEYRSSCRSCCIILSVPVKHVHPSKIQATRATCQTYIYLYIYIALLQRLGHNSCRHSRPMQLPRRLPT